MNQDADQWNSPAASHFGQDGQTKKKELCKFHLNVSPKFTTGIRIKNAYFLKIIADDFILM